MGPRQRQGHSRSKTHALPIILLSFLGFLLIAGVAFGIGMLGNVNRWLSDLPDYTDANAYLVSEPTEIVDCNGNKIASFYTQNRKSITKDEVSPYVLQGTVDVEDERFYEHGGIDLWGIARAAVATLGGGHEGASTITQQLVRNTILQEEQFDSTIERKVREAYIAIKMEDMYSKDEILMMYLNTIYYGHGAYGIEAAAETYLSKSAADLTLSEAALLIGLPNSPSQYDPTVNPDLALSRRNKVLDNMLRLGHITQEEHDAAQAEPITLNVTEISGSGVDVYSQPYFVAYVKQLLEQEFSTDVLFKGGLTVKTTIDPTMQQVAENAVREQLDTLSLDGLDMGMVVVDPKTGYIKCMVGGYDYNADENHVNHATAKRPVGSTFKAFTLATAIQNGMNPNVTLNCNSPLKAKGTTTEVQNYANQSYGNITLKQATAYSSNTGYIQVAEAVGNSKIISLVKKLGIDPAKDVKIEYYSEASEVTAQMAATKKDAIAVLPQPYVTAAQMKDSSLRVVLDLTREWNKVCDTQLITGVTVVRTAYAEEHPEEVINFLKDYQKSVDAANDDLDGTAALCEEVGVVAKAAIAKKALPKCNIVYRIGDEMKADVNAYLQVLYDASPAAVGGKLPDANFYYTEATVAKRVQKAFQRLVNSLK